jgi:hypothetical protein
MPSCGARFTAFRKGVGGRIQALKVGGGSLNH